MTEEPQYDFDMFARSMLSGPETLNGFLEGIAGIMNNSRDAVLFVNLQQQVMFFTKGAERMFGYAASEVVGRTMWHLAVPEEIPSNEAQFEQFIQSDVRVIRSPAPLNARHRTGQVFPVELIASRMPTPQGGLICVLLHDLSQIMSIEQELRATQQQLHAILDNTSQQHVLLDMDLVVRAFNRAGADASKHFGGPELIAGRRLADYIGGMLQADFEHGFAEARAGRASTFEVPLVSPSLEEAWVEVSIRPVRGDNGHITGFLVSAMDITRHKQMEEALRKSERRHRALFEHNKDAIFVADVNTGMLIDANPQAQALTLRSLNELQAMHQAQLHPADTFQMAVDKFQAAARNPGSNFLEMFVVDRDGNEIPVEISSTGTIAEDGRDVVFGVFRDITERRRAELALRELNDSLEHRVAERTDALLGSLDDLNSANLALEKALQHKDEFLASMSHELRTPLTGVLGLSEALQLGIYGPMSERQQEALNQIEHSGRHLLNLINDLLDVAKIDAGKLTLNIEPIFAGDICRSSLSMVRQLAVAKEQQLTSTLIPEDLQLMADARRLKQMLVNLLSNAVKFTPPGGLIDLVVIADRIAGVVNLTVADTGIGISMEELPKLFHPFSQLEARKGDELIGTGLGLSLVLRLAELHNGSVSVQSEPNVGSRFTITLPWEAPAVKPPKTIEPTTKFPPRPRTIVTVLVVEDNPTTASLLSDFLVGRGYRVVTATNGADAVTTVVTSTPDLVLMDVQMRGVDGLEATRRIRSLDEKVVSKTPIIALTALAMPGDRERCLAAGMDEYLCKPINFVDLAFTIERVLDLRSKVSAAAI